MTSTSDSSPIFENGKLKQGIYRLQNSYSHTYLDVEVHSSELCCRSERELGEGKGLWEIKQLGAGHTIRRVDPGAPEQFCAPGITKRAGRGTVLCVTAYPVAWRIGSVNYDNHDGFEYVRFFWATTDMNWSLEGDKIKIFPEWAPDTMQIWRLIPMEVEDTVTTPCSSLGTVQPRSLPPYDGDPGGSSTHTQHTEAGSDESGTFVNEVTVVTTTVTTRKRYRAEDVQMS